MGVDRGVRRSDGMLVEVERRKVFCNLSARMGCKYSEVRYMWTATLSSRRSLPGPQRTEF